MIARLVPLVELNRVFMRHLVSQSNEICDLRTKCFVNTMYADVVDRAFAAAFVDDCALGFEDFIIQDEIVHFRDEVIILLLILGFFF